MAMKPIGFLRVPGNRLIIFMVQMENPSLQINQITKMYPYMYQIFRDMEVEALINHTLTKDMVMI